MEEVYMSEEYSDVPWETAPPGFEQRASSSLAPDIAGPSSSNSYDGPSLTTFALNANDALTVTITDSQKHGEGSSAFVTYAVASKTTLDSFPRSTMSTRRRFQDFVWLHRTLTDEYPACIIPPLPGKHRMEYITGDRFSAEFIEKRRHSLQTYMDRITRHPTLQRSQAIRKFLETGDLIGVEAAAKNRDSHVFETISDVILNVVTKVRKPDERFVDFKENVEKFEENLKTVERLHSKLLKEQADLQSETNEFHGSLVTMGSMETQITEPLTEFSKTVQEVSKLLKEKSQRDESDFVGGLREYIAYCQSVKVIMIKRKAVTEANYSRLRFLQEVLRARDQKQVDHEELERYLDQETSERDKTASGRSDGSLTGFIRDKYNDFRNVNQEQARKAKLEKLEAKIVELREAVEESNREATVFSNEVIKEMDLFNAVKVQDFKGIMRDCIESQMEFYQKGVKVWDNIIPVLQNIEIDPQGPAAPVSASF
ncbi:intercellular trafficking and secretion [Geranomyces michiganensis]|nr:intercellular trafficking and secretion [Geranomyces michiganensis]